MNRIKELYVKYRPYLAGLGLVYFLVGGFWSHSLWLTLVGICIMTFVLALSPYIAAYLKGLLNHE